MIWMGPERWSREHNSSVASAVVILKIDRGGCRFYGITLMALLYDNFTGAIADPKYVCSTNK